MTRSLPFVAFCCAAILLAAAIALVPILWMASMAFRPIPAWQATGEAPTWLQKAPMPENFQFIFCESNSDRIVVLDRTAAKPITALQGAVGIDTLVAMLAGTAAA